MNKLENWYRELGKQRKIFVYVVSCILIGLFGLGFILLISSTVDLTEQGIDLMKKVISQMLGIEYESICFGVRCDLTEADFSGLLLIILAILIGIAFNGAIKLFNKYNTLQQQIMRELF